MAAMKQDLPACGRPLGADTTAEVADHPSQRTGRAIGNVDFGIVTALARKDNFVAIGRPSWPAVKSWGISQPLRSAPVGVGDVGDVSAM